MSNQYNRYSMRIQWSVPDNTYIVTTPELPGCQTTGDTYEEAIRHGQEAIDVWVDAHKKSGKPIPPPWLYES